MSFCQIFGGRAKVCTKLSFELACRLEMKNSFHHSSYLIEFYQNGSFGNFLCVGSQFGGNFLKQYYPMNLRGILEPVTASQIPRNVPTKLPPNLLLKVLPKLPPNLLLKVPQKLPPNLVLQLARKL